MIESGLYLHIPFCEKRCNYCNFFSSVKNDEIKSKYVDELCAEIEKISKKYGEVKLNTIYFGGGTPSLLSLHEFDKIFSSINKSFYLNKPEITVEINPNSAENISFYPSFGINRLSVGIQSSSDKYLKILGRLHDSITGKKTLEKAANIFDNVSGDIIIGIDDNQSVKDEFEYIYPYVKHFSCYMLTIEENTRLAELIKNKSVSVATENAVVRQYEEMTALAESRGFTRYETSNFALPTFESKHNCSYWNLTAYIGVGAGAYSYFDGRRYFNKSDLRSYLEGVHSGNGGEIIEREKSVSDDKEEFVMLSLRTKNGVIFNEYKKKFGTDFFSDYEKGIKKSEEYLSVDSDKICILPKYFAVQNSIICSVLQV